MSASSNWKINGGDGVVLEGVLKLRHLFSMGLGIILSWTHFLLIGLVIIDSSCVDAYTFKILVSFVREQSLTMLNTRLR